MTDSPFWLEKDVRKRGKGVKRFPRVYPVPLNTQNGPSFTRCSGRKASMRRSRADGKRALDAPDRGVVWALRTLGSFDLGCGRTARL